MRNKRTIMRKNITMGWGRERWVRGKIKKNWKDDERKWLKKLMKIDGREEREMREQVIVGVMKVKEKWETKNLDRKNKREKMIIESNCQSDEKERRVRWKKEKK